MEGSSSQQSKSKGKDKPIGPISIHTDGKPFGPHYAALVDHISRHVSHCDEFSPLLSWTEHKHAGQIEVLYNELTPIFTLPELNDQHDSAIEFRKWFNNTARQRYNDHKWRSLYRTFERCNGDITMASQHVPARLDKDTWVALCEQYAANILPDESGLSMKDKRKSSRSSNDINHHLGRDALSVWRGKFRNERGREPTPPEIYHKAYLKMDPLDASPGSYPDPSPRGRPVTQVALETGTLLQQNYEAALADCSDESTASTQASLSTFGRVTKLGMSAPKGTNRPTKKNAYSSQLEEQLKNMNEQRDIDRERIKQLEQTQKDMEANQKTMQDMLSQFMSFQQTAGHSGWQGAGRGQSSWQGTGGSPYGGRGTGSGQPAWDGAGSGQSPWFGGVAGQPNWGGAGGEQSNWGGAGGQQSDREGDACDEYDSE